MTHSEDQSLVGRRVKTVKAQLTATIVATVSIPHKGDFHVLQFDDLNEGDYRLWKSDTLGFELIEETE